MIEKFEQGLKLLRKQWFWDEIEGESQIRLIFIGGYHATKVSFEKIRFFKSDKILDMS